MALFNVRVYGILMVNDCIVVSDEWIRGDKITKFPGGGLEIGEGTRDCLQREIQEEMGLKASIGGHFYTTDFYQMSAFNTAHQIISIYYFAEPQEEIKTVFKQTPFDFSEAELLKYEQTKETETFRLISKWDFSENDVHLPIDKVVAKMLKQEWNSIP